MGYQLREGVTFCRVTDRFVFLDIVRDRYFCLPEAAERAFAHLVATGAPPTRESDALIALRHEGLLVEVPTQTKPEPCSGPPEPRVSLLDAGRTASPLQVFLALAHRLSATRQVKRVPFAQLLDDMSDRKAPLVAAPRAEAQAVAIAAAFRRAALCVSARDQCLATSFAVMRQLLAAGVPADLVLGVKLRPFQAHCWVQLDDAVVNDRVDTVAAFTPILVL